MENMLKRRIAHFIAAIAILVVLWEALSDILCIPFIPSPLSIWLNLCSNFAQQISVHAAWSLFRIIAGVMISVIIGLPVGLCAGYYKKFGSIIKPIIYLTYPVPKIALLPVVMLIFGLDESSKIVIIVLIVMFQVIITLRDAAQSIPKETFYSLISLGANSRMIFAKIIIPACVPALLTSVRVSLGTALSVLFFTETFGTQYGLGYYIMDSWMRVDYTDMFSGIVALSLLGLILFIIIDCLESFFCRWKHI